VLPEQGGQFALTRDHEICDGDESRKRDWIVESLLRLETSSRREAFSDSP
jgi:hypothetical protein